MIDMFFPLHIGRFIILKIKFSYSIYYNVVNFQFGISYNLIVKLHLDIQHIELGQTNNLIVNAVQHQTHLSILT